MPRSKVNRNKERHTVWMSSQAWNRIDRMALKAAGGKETKKNTSEMLESAAMAFKTNEQEMFTEMKRIVALKITAAQEEMNLLLQAEKAAILRKKKEEQDEIDNSLRAVPA